MPAEREAHVVRTARLFWLARGLGAIALALACAWAIRAGGGFAIIMGSLGVALFGAMTLFALRQLLRRGPRLVLDPTGVDAADLGIGVVPWRDIEGVQLFGSPQAPFIAFHLRDPAPHVARLSPWPRFVTKLLAAQGLPLFSINLIGVDREPAEIVRQARAYLAGQERDGIPAGR
jgi:hypothetical protein